ncbi:hypothetical protein DFJ74DRAFT_364987 [Hyaloraphidium curvatum]|nr:hypothetical protein DFJ74DRAFT_364987 [Hyaloraphidium curvatum]
MEYQERIHQRWTRRNRSRHVVQQDLDGGVLVVPDLLPDPACRDHASGSRRTVPTERRDRSHLSSADGLLAASSFALLTISGSATTPPPSSTSLTRGSALLLRGRSSPLSELATEDPLDLALAASSCLLPALSFSPKFLSTSPMSSTSTPSRGTASPLATFPLAASATVAEYSSRNPSSVSPRFVTGAVPRSPLRRSRVCSVPSSEARERSCVAIATSRKPAIFGRSGGGSGALCARPPPSAKPGGVTVRFPVRGPACAPRREADVPVIHPRRRRRFPKSPSAAGERDGAWV